MTNNEHNPIVAGIHEGLNAKFKVAFTDENGEPQEITSSLGDVFAPLDSDQIKRDILASMVEQKKSKNPKKQRRGFWQL